MHDLWGRYAPPQAPHVFWGCRVRIRTANDDLVRPIRRETRTNLRGSVSFLTSSVWAGEAARCFMICSFFDMPAIVRQPAPSR